MNVITKNAKQQDERRYYMMKNNKKVYLKKVEQESMYSFYLQLFFMLSYHPLFVPMVIEADLKMFYAVCIYNVFGERAFQASTLLLFYWRNGTFSDRVYVILFPT